MTKTVIIVNGRPRAGKDSTIAAMTNILNANRVRTMAFSSIDPVRDMLTRAGFDLSQKTPADRALMAEVGNSVEKHGHWRSQRCFQEIYTFFDNTKDDPAVMFLHVREPYLIERIGERVKKHGWDIVHVLVSSIREERTASNDADRNVEAMRYDHVIQNNGTLDELALACDKFLFNKNLISQLSLLHR